MMMPRILVFTISAANSDQYIASRTLYGMCLTLVKFREVG
jgi:amino acid permease